MFLDYVFCFGLAFYFRCFRLLDLCILVCACGFGLRCDSCVYAFGLCVSWLFADLIRFCVGVFCDLGCLFAFGFGLGWVCCFVLCLR